jgi:hypothetical protein
MIDPASTDSSLRWITPSLPEVTAPALVVMLSGWIDAGGAAEAAMTAIRTETEASPVATFDDDVYIDFRARRPTMELREGLNTVLQYDHITVSVGRDQAGHDLVLLWGPEPDMAWHRFADAVGELAVGFGVSKMVALGAYPFAAPHTRASRLSLSTPSQDLLMRLPYLRSSIDVPAGVAAALEHAMHERGIPAVGIWAQVPHYVATMSYPPAAVALLDGLRECADVVIDGAELRQAGIQLRERLDTMVAGNDEHVRMVAQLEELHDASDDTVPTDDSGGGVGGDQPPGLGQTGRAMPSGDEIAAEFERFLRDQD